MLGLLTLIAWTIHLLLNTSFHLIFINPHLLACWSFSALVLTGFLYSQLQPRFRLQLHVSEDRHIFQPGL